MRQGLNFTKHTLKSYYNVVKAFEEYSTNSRNHWFLDYCYEMGLQEFQDEYIHHSAMEYNCPEANVIIATAERIEEFLNDIIKDDEEWNGLLEECQK